MRFSTLVYLYGRRLRKRAGQELLAGLGSAVGVALVFAVLVANSSVTTGSAQIVKSLAGRASLQLVARSDTGFDEAIARQAQALASVKRTAPLLYVPGTVQSATGHVAVQVTGAELSLAVLDGLVARLPLGHLALSARVVMLPAAT